MLRSERADPEFLVSLSFKPLDPLSSNGSRGFLVLKNPNKKSYILVDVNFCVVIWPTNFGRFNDQRGVDLSLHIAG